METELHTFKLCTLPQIISTMDDDQTKKCLAMLRKAKSDNEHMAALLLVLCTETQTLHCSIIAHYAWSVIFILGIHNDHRGPIGSYKPLWYTSGSSVAPYEV